MPNPQQLTMLTDLAEERHDRAAKKLARALTMLRDSESRLALLENYCTDYRARLARNAAAGVAPAEMRNFRDFIARLEEAIGQQRTEVEAIKKGVADCRTGWMLERRRKQSYEVLIERADLAQREVEARRLQKLVDEFAGRAAAMRIAV
jgi:flagellar FliJ protein